MMKFILIFIAVFSQLLATNLLTYNIYNRSDRVDIMLSFDTSYDGQLSQKEINNKLVLKLSNLSYNSSINKNLNSDIVQNILINPDKNYLNIIISSKNQIGVIASKTADGFGLRLRIKNTKKYKKNDYKPLFTKQVDKKTQYYNDSPLETRYILVVVILLVLLIIMFWIKKRFSNNSPRNKSSWLFNKTSANLKGINILYKKPIDNNNSAILLEFKNKKYLIISGSSNLLLDTFDENALEDRSDFEKAFNENKKKLDEYLKIQDKKLETYKEKASSQLDEDFNFYK